MQKILQSNAHVYGLWLVWSEKIVAPRGGGRQVRHWIYSPGFDPLNHKKTGYVPGTW